MKTKSKVRAGSLSSNKNAKKAGLKVKSKVRAGDPATHGQF